MIGAIEILIIALIFGIIYGRDAIDKTFRKSADEGVVESMAGDLKEYYEADPKRMIKLGVLIFGASAFLIKTPACAPRPVAVIIDMGVASPKAQGQAIISTATAETRP